MTAPVHDEASTDIVVDGVRRRRITLTEALRLADEIMRRAEEGRITAAEQEAFEGTLQ